LNFSSATSLWNGFVAFDVPKFTYVLRSGLIKTGGIWNSITGYSSYYMGMGGEMGYDASNNFNNSLQILLTPWQATNAGVGGVNEIVDSGYTFNNAKLIARDDNSWYGLYWIGELYPDSSYGTWSTSGNLPIGVGNFYRADYSIAGIGGSGTNLPQKRTNTSGCASFFNGNPTGTGSTYYNHSFPSSPNDIGNITSTGNVIADDFNYPLLLTMSAQRPFRLDDSGSTPPEWNNSFNINSRTSLSVMQSIYDTNGLAPTFRSSAILSFSTSSTGIGYAVMNGLSPQANFGASEIGKLCVVSLLRAYLGAGAPGVTSNPIAQIPRIAISSPLVTDQLVNPNTINIVWLSTWTRWDSQNYTQAYPLNYIDTNTVVLFNIKYSTDNGKTFVFIQDNAPAVAGIRDSNAPHAITTAPFTYSWDVSNVTTFPRGTYIVLIECYRNNYPLHYSFQERRLYIRR